MFALSLLGNLHWTLSRASVEVVPHYQKLLCMEFSSSGSACNAGHCRTSSLRLYMICKLAMLAGEYADGEHAAVWGLCYSRRGRIYAALTRRCLKRSLASATVCITHSSLCHAISQRRRFRKRCTFCRICHRRVSIEIGAVCGPS